MSESIFKQDLQARKNTRKKKALLKQRAGSPLPGTSGSRGYPLPTLSSAPTGDQSELLTASSTGNIGEVNALLNGGTLSADINQQDSAGLTALMLASRNGHTEVVVLLLSKGADIDIQSNEGESALMIASSGGHIKVAELLLGRGASVDMQDKIGESALMKASG